MAVAEESSAFRTPPTAEEIEGAHHEEGRKDKGKGGEPEG
jgi:hypothetical protein